MQIEKPETARYTLQSSSLVYAPGVIGYAMRLNECGDSENARNIINSWPGLPADVVTGLLDGTVTYSVDSDKEVVVIEVPAKPTA